MGKVTVLLIITALLVVSQAEEVLQVTLEWNKETLHKINETKLEKKVKRSRSAQRGGRSGAASNWYWELQTSSGAVVQSSFFQDPTILCTGDHSNHVILDSTQFIIEVPMQKGSTLKIYNNGSAGATLVGTAIINRSTSALATFTLEGGVK